MARVVGPEGRILAIEASIATADVCRQNIELNNLQNVEIKNEAVSDKDGFLSTTGDSNVEIISGYSVSKSVRAIPLDIYFEYNPGFIKIDIEGFEVMALRGMPRLLQMHPVLEIEVHTDLLKNYNTSVSELVNYLLHCPIHISFNGMIFLVASFNLEQPITRRVHLFALPK